MNIMPGVRGCICAMLIFGCFCEANTIARGDDSTTLQSLMNEVTQLVFAGRDADAEAAANKLVEFTDRVFRDDAQVQFAVAGLVTMMYELQNRSSAADPFIDRGLGLSGRLGDVSAEGVSTVVTTLNMFASACSQRERYVEEIRLRKRAVQIVETTRGTGHPDLIQPLIYLGLAAGTGRNYREAEHYYRRAVSIGDSAPGQKSPYFIMAVSFLASSLQSQNRLVEAERVAQRAIAISEQVGSAAGGIPGSLGMLAGIYERQGRYADAEPLRKRALIETQKMALLLKEQFVASSKVDLARLYRRQKRFEEAETLLQEVIAELKAATPSPDKAAFTGPLLELVQLDDDRGRTAAAQQTLARIFADANRLTSVPYALRARLHWKLNERNEALADMAQALDIAEQDRKGGSGGEQERAEFYSQYGDLFESMIGWQHDLRNAGAAFAAAERFRARSMIDQLEVRGVDLLAGVVPEEAARLRQNENRARTDVAELEKHVGRARKPDPDVSAGTTLIELDAKLANARQTLIEAYREIRNTSSTYRLAVHADYRPADLGSVQSRLARSRELLLHYTLGKDRSFVIVAPPAPEPPVIQELVVSPESAKVLGIEPGPFTVETCRELLNRGGRSIGPAGASRGLDLGVDTLPSVAVDRLAALWQILVPQPQREALMAGQFAGLVVIPDGPLSLLPFEMLVIERDSAGAPRYLLDGGPPVRYSPSATVLENLTDRAGAPENTDLPTTVLTVGDPVYSRQSDERVEDSALDRFEVAAKYRSALNGLSRLPATRIESEKLATAFRERGHSVEHFLGQLATEERIRDAVPGCRIVHLACHGLADQNYGNFFGALAMTPGIDGDTNPGNDGFLTLPEIYALRLNGCELAILSACETNYGPQHDGEGTFALSRGFLVAGARRIVASDWLVDDQATAELIGEFAVRLSAGYAGNGSVAHATALQSAKRRVRQQSRWSDPYYWAAFVLIGPD